jgi:hypothetical protein
MQKVIRIGSRGYDKKIMTGLHDSSYTYIIPAMHQKQTMRKREVRKTHAYSAQRSESKKYAKAERRKRRKAR